MGQRTRVYISRTRTEDPSGVGELLLAGRAYARLLGFALRGFSRFARGRGRDKVKRNWSQVLHPGKASENGIMPPIRVLQEWMRRF